MSRRQPKVQRGNRIEVEICVPGRSRTLKSDLGARGLNGITTEFDGSQTTVRGSVSRTKVYDLAERAQEEGARGIVITHDPRGQEYF
jgi:hypothetical protein